jgi:hypothetical protein
VPKGAKTCQKVTNLPTADSKATQLDQQIIACKLEGLSIDEIALKCGMGKRTVQRKMAQPQFKVKYDEAKSQLLEDVVDGLRSSGMVGVGALRDVAGDRNSRSTARVAAAKAILEIMLRVTETQALVARLDKLEAAVKDADL